MQKEKKNKLFDKIHNSIHDCSIKLKEFNDEQDAQEEKRDTDHIQRMEDILARMSPLAREMYLHDEGL